MSTNALLWIDHKEARLFLVTLEEVTEKNVLAPLRNTHHKHPKGPEGVREHPGDMSIFFKEVCQALQGIKHLVIVGPSTAKLEFLRYLSKHDRALDDAVAGIETVDHPTNSQLIAYAKQYFGHSRHQPS